MILIAIVIGILAGFAAIGIRALILEISNLSFTGTGNMLENIISTSWFWIIIIPMIGGLIVGPIIYFFAPEAKGHGVPEVMQAILLKGGAIRGRVAFVKAIASAVTLVFMFFQHMTDPKLIEILAEKLSMLEIVEYWKITLYIMVLAAGWWSSSFIRDIVDTGKIIFTWLITKIKSMFAKLFGIKIEIDLAFIDQRVWVMYGIAIPFIFSTIRYDNLISRSPGAIR